MSATAREGPLASLGFTGRWRPYQRMAIDAFDRDVAAGRTRTHIVAPPGSGKTLLGVELVRRLGSPAVVLTPNSAVQAQWPEAVARFGDVSVVSHEPGAPIAVLTYQSLCRLEDPERVLGDLAARRWSAERARATGESIEEVAATAGGWTGEAARRRSREISRIGNAIKREIARAEHGDLHLGNLLHPAARERLEALRAAGVRTIVLDECHHLASLWGYVVRLVVEELHPGAHLVGLTATPPGDLTTDEAALYESLLGPVDFTVPTPAVVKDGHLAPYQELAWLTEPLPAEERWLGERDARFRELIATLHEDPAAPLSFPSWVIERMRERATGDEDVSLAWASFARRSPRLARAGVRFLASAGLAPPPGAPTGEGYREEPSLDDWLVLLQDYVLRRLRTDPSPAAARDAAIAAALRDLGYAVTRQGIRRGASEVDRLLTSSAAKPLALVEVLSLEHAARGDAIRALVLCDAERRAASPDDELSGVLAPTAGTAAEAVLALAADARTAHLAPVLVSGRGVRCAPADAARVVEALRRRAPAGLSAWRSEEDDDGLVRVEAGGAGWTPRTWVRLATDAFTAGEVRAMVGTRALLGEGWNAPCVNCLVDLSSATTRVSITQMRGRSLRLDPEDPDKLADNWDVVCVAPGHARGEADYLRFVRKHEHLFAPADDGVIEAGPSHVHPALGPFSPPAREEFAEINRQMARRAANPDRARELWRLGEAYAGEESVTLVVRPRSGEAPVRAGAPADPGQIPAGTLRAALAIGRLRDEMNGVLPLERAALAVRDALVLLGDLSLGAAASLTIEPRASGYLRVALRAASPVESARFATALDQLITPPAGSRYVVSRQVPGRRGGFAAVARVLTRRAPYEVRQVQVPDDLARHRDRATVFAQAWARWFGPTELRFTQRDHTGRLALAEARAGAPGADCTVRTIWR